MWRIQVFLSTLVMAITLNITLLAPLSAAESEDTQFSNEMKDLRRIGFQLFADGSRVFVETTEPTRYSVDTSRRGLVVLTLENTRIPLRNNRRPLVTRYFDSPIRFVQASVLEGQGSTARIEIHLRRKVPFKEIQNDTFLALDFRH